MRRANPIGADLPRHTCDMTPAQRAQWDAGQPERDRKHWARVRAGLAADVGNPATALFNKFAAEDAAKRALAGISEQILEVV